MYYLIFIILYNNTHIIINYSIINLFLEIEWFKSIKINRGYAVMTDYWDHIKSYKFIKLILSLVLLA